MISIPLPPPPPLPPPLPPPPHRRSFLFHFSVIYTANCTRRNVMRVLLRKCLAANKGNKEEEEEQEEEEEEDKIDNLFLF